MKNYSRLWIIFPMFPINVMQKLPLSAVWTLSAWRRDGHQRVSYRRIEESYRVLFFMRKLNLHNIDMSSYRKVKIIESVKNIIDKKRVSFFKFDKFQKMHYPEFGTSRWASLREYTSCGVLWT